MIDDLKMLVIDKINLLLQVNDILHKNEKYPMGGSQPAQVDCRLTSCRYHGMGACHNISPAITLNPDGTCVCWSKEKKDTEAKKHAK